MAVWRTQRTAPESIQASLTGPITSIKTLFELANRFMLDANQARATLSDVLKAITSWRTVALSAEVGLKPQELDDFAPAFEHEELDLAQSLLASNY